MSSPHRCRTAAVFIAWLILRGQDPVSAESAEDRIYWADMNGIHWSNLREGTTQRIIAADTRRPGKIAVDVLEGKIYWVDRRSSTIQRSDMDGSDSEMLVGLTGLVELTGLGGGYVTAADLDLDLGRRKIYFTVNYYHGDYTSGLVCRADFDGSNVEFLGENFNSAATPLALDWEEGAIYLGTWDFIYRLDQDGSGSEDVLGPQTVGDIALDLVAGKLYWTDPYGRVIRRSNADGSDVEDLLTELEEPPVEIAFDREGGKVYWSIVYDFGSSRQSYGGLLRANLDGFGMERVLERAEVFGFTLDLHGRKVYWTDARGTIQRADLDGSNVEDLIAPPARAPYAVALHAADGRIYWTDLLAGTVQRAGRDGSEHEVLVEGLDMPKGVCLGGDRIYWADWAAGKIQSARLDGSDMDDTAVGLEHPDKVAVGPVHGRIYWTEPTGPRIGWAALDGSDVGGFSVDSVPQGIALDVSRGEVYWTWDDYKGSTGIRRSSLEGADRDDVVTTSSFEVYKAIALDPVGGRIHWTTLFTPPVLDPIHSGPYARVGVRRAGLDGSNVEEPAWLYGVEDTWVLAGSKVSWRESMGSALALDLSRQTSVSAHSSVPLSTTLRSSYPNPFNGSTLISYTLAAPGPVSLVVYNALGQPVHTLVDEVQAPGLYSVPWQPPEALASGVYLYRLTTFDAVLARRLALLR